MSSPPSTVPDASPSTPADLNVIPTPPFNIFTLHVPPTLQVPSISGHTLAVPEALPRSSHDRVDDSLTRRRSSRIAANTNLPSPRSVTIPKPRHSYPLSVSLPSPPPPVPSSLFPPAVDTKRLVTDHLLDAVVRVTAVICQPNYDLPWQMRQEFTAVSTAFAIEGRRLLTVAHGVRYHTVIRVKKRSSDTQFHARVLCMSEICDLALLTVDDDAFWEEVSTVKLGGLPVLQDAVVTVGYPATGVNICITSGVTSRIEMRNGYLTVQIDAAINPGNSGGPAFAADGTVAGIAFQKNDGNENTGFLIATDVVRHFLQDYDKNGKFSGSCLCGFIWQTLPDADFRRYLQMKEQDSGVLVVEVAKHSPAHRKLKADDVVMRVDGVPVSNAGKIAHASGERLSFHALIVEKFPGDEIELDVLRGGDNVQVRYNVRESAHGEVVRQYVDERKPEYAIVGGLVLVAMTEDYVADGYGADGRNRPGNLVSIGMQDEELLADGVHQVVLISKVLNDEINVEYAHIIDQRVHTCNKKKVTSLQQLKMLVDECKEEFVRFDLDYEVVVLDRKKAIQANERIKEIHHIPALSRLYANEESGGNGMKGGKDGEGEQEKKSHFDSEDEED